MDFGLSEEQELLKAEVRKFLDARCPLEQVRKIMETGPGYSAELWQELAELGWLGLTIPFPLYGIFRYLYLVHQREGGGSPTDQLLHDPPLLACVTLWVAALVLIIYYRPVP
jgi:alkylation response protein AidB-like acyl-CoA dehydrogenase